MTQRNEYCRELAGLAVAAVPNTLAGALRQPTLADAEPLAELMLDAYRGTIDDGGETIDNARDEVASYMASVLNPPLLSCSFDERILERFAPAPEPPLKMTPSSSYQFRMEPRSSSTSRMKHAAAC